MIIGWIILKRMLMLLWKKKKTQVKWVICLFDLYSDTIGMQQPFHKKGNLKYLWCPGLPSPSLSLFQGYAILFFATWVLKFTELWTAEMDGFERASVPVMPILIQPGCHTHSVCLGQAGVQQERERSARQLRFMVPDWEYRSSGLGDEILLLGWKEGADE